MSELEPGVNNCTLVALTRVFAYYRDNMDKAKIPNNTALYEDIKLIAQENGYTKNDGVFPTRIDNIIKKVFRKYEYWGTGKNIYLWNFNTVKKEIDAGRPLLLNVAFGYYEKHTVTVVGYSEYTKGKGLFKQRKTFLKVIDGWDKDDRYIDFELFSRTNLGSFSTIMFIE